MLINVGTQNPSKLQGVKEAIALVPQLKDAEIKAIEVDSGVHHQPKSFEEIVKGAKTRAKNAYKDCDLSIGLESGIAQIPGTITGWMDFSCCAIFDGKRYFLGLSQAFEFPPAAIKKVTTEDKNISQAFRELGYTQKSNLGNEEGAIGLLAKGRVMRKDLNKEAVLSAIIPWENKELYG